MFDVPIKYQAKLGQYLPRLGDIVEIDCLMSSGRFVGRVRIVDQMPKWQWSEKDKKMVETEEMMDFPPPVWEIVEGNDTLSVGHRIWGSWGDLVVSTLDD
jgi:hypothetical protein